MATGDGRCALENEIGCGRAAVARGTLGDTWESGAETEWRSYERAEAIVNVGGIFRWGRETDVCGRERWESGREEEEKGCASGSVAPSGLLLLNPALQREFSLFLCPPKIDYRREKVGEGGYLS